MCTLGSRNHIQGRYTSVVWSSKADGKMMRPSMTTNIRRLDTLPDGRLVQLFQNSVKIGGIDHPLPSTSMDMANYDNHVAVLMRGTPTQIWTVEDTFIFEDNTPLYSRIHPFAPALTGRKTMGSRRWNRRPDCTPMEKHYSLSDSRLEYPQARHRTSSTCLNGVRLCPDGFG